MTGKKSSSCITCGVAPLHTGFKYCSILCQQEYQHHAYIDKWKRGEVNGLQRLGLVSAHVKKFLRKKYRNKCCLCGWNAVNPVTGKVPLVADHIDGDWQNNCEDNLRLICPNCDSLSPTYAALNKGRGRKDRPASKRVQTAHKLMPASRSRK